MEESIKSKYAFSMESIPRQKSFACLPLKFGCLLTGLLVILYSVLALAQCMAVLMSLPPQMTSSDVSGIVMYGFVIGVTITHAVTLFLSAVMLVGAIREKGHLMRPWIIWMSVHVMVLMFMFIFSITMHMLNHFADTSLLVFVIEFLGLLIRFYMLMIVVSYYKEVEELNSENEKLVSLITSETWYTA